MNILFRGRRVPEVIYLRTERRLQEGHSVFRDFYPISGREEGVEAQDEVRVTVEQLRHAVYHARRIDTAEHSQLNQSGSTTRINGQSGSIKHVYIQVQPYFYLITVKINLSH